jgi:hypothetical protein
VVASVPWLYRQEVKAGDVQVCTASAYIQNDLQHVGCLVMCCKLWLLDKGTVVVNNGCKLPRLIAMMRCNKMPVCTVMMLYHLCKDYEALRLHLTVDNWSFPPS